MDKERQRSGTSATIASTTSSGSNRVKPLLESFVDPATDGQVVEMAHFTAGGQNLLCYVTTKGRLCGLDLRSNETVWRLINNPKFGKLDLSLRTLSFSSFSPIYSPCHLF